MEYGQYQEWPCEPCYGYQGRDVEYQEWEQPWQPWGGAGRVGEHLTQPLILPPSSCNPLTITTSATSPQSQKVPSTPSPISISSSDSRTFNSIFSQEFAQPPQAASLPASPPSSHSSGELEQDTMFTFHAPHPPPQYNFPPIQLRNNQSFTEAELKAITPWRNQLLERLLANRSLPSSQPPRGSQPKARPPPSSKPRPPLLRPGTPLFQDTSHLQELDLGPGSSEYLAKVRSGTTAFLAIQGAIQQTNCGAGTVRAVVETMLKYCLPRDLSEYSLTGKSLQERLEVRNGQAQSRVIMAEQGSSKHGVPGDLLLGLVTFLEQYLTEAGRRSAGGAGLASYTRKLVSKTCSRSQERKNQEIRSQEFRRSKRQRVEQ